MQDAAAWPIQGLIKNYMQDMEKRAEGGEKEAEKIIKATYQKAWSGLKVNNHEVKENETTEEELIFMLYSG